MLETAAWADQAGGASEVGRGEMRRCKALYASAEVEEDVDSQRWTVRGRREIGQRLRDARRGRARMAFREVMMDDR